MLRQNFSYFLVSSARSSGEYTFGLVTSLGDAGVTALLLFLLEPRRWLIRASCSLRSLRCSGVSSFVFLRIFSPFLFGLVGDLVGEEGTGLLLGDIAEEGVVVGFGESPGFPAEVAPPSGTVLAMFCSKTGSGVSSLIGTTVPDILFFVWTNKVTFFHFAVALFD